jgi:hypothetical protein
VKCAGAFFCGKNTTPKVVDKLVKPQYNIYMKTKHYIYKETTDWGEYICSNNIYIFTEPPKGQRSVKCVAYIKQGSKTVERFKKPYTFDLRGRTFEEVV